MKHTIDELLEKPYWIIDILPAQVPANSGGQYFAVEKYFLTEPRRYAVKHKHTNVILKLNCYRDISLDEDAAVNPPPEQVAEAICGRRVSVMVDDAMIVSEPDETFMTLYHPNAALLRLVKAIAGSEGLFVWQP